MPCYSGVYPNSVWFLKIESAPPQKSSRKFTYIYRKVCTGNHKIILTLLFVLSTVAVAGQTSLSTNGLTGPKLAVTPGSRRSVFNDRKLTDLPARYREILQAASTFLQPAGGNGLQPVEKNRYVNGFAFFCRQELKLEKKLRIPVRLRVGSLEQCNKLEQKD